MSLIYENGATLTKEDIRDSIEYESPVDGIMLTLTVSILLGLIFVGMWAALMNTEDAEAGRAFAEGPQLAGYQPKNSGAFSCKRNCSTLT